LPLWKHGLCPRYSCPTPNQTPIVRCSSRGLCAVNTDDPGPISSSRFGTKQNAEPGLDYRA
jgi:hypothetical protein